MMLRLYRFFSLLLVSLLFLNTVDVKAESASPLAVDVGAVAEIPQKIPLYKVKRIQMDSDKVQAAVKQYGIQPLVDEKWKLMVNSTLNPDFAVLYYEESGAVEPVCPSYSGPPSPAQKEDTQYQRASQVVKAFLDDIGLHDYEYPFYYCDDAFCAVVGSVWNPLSAEEYLDSGWSAPNAIRKEWARTNGPSIMVVVRFVVEGLPFGTSISWTEHSQKAGNGNPTPTAVFHVTREGQISGIAIRNPVRITAQRDHSAAFLSWNEVFDMNRAMLLERYTKGEHVGNILTLRYAELVMLTDDQNIVFPAWHFVFEETIGESYRKKYCPDLSDFACISTLGLYFHAYTGKEV